MNDQELALVLSLVDNTHPSATEFLDDAVVRDGSPDHWRESYVWETGKSMKVRRLATFESVS